MMPALLSRNTATKKHDRSFIARPFAVPRQDATESRRPDWLKPRAAEEHVSFDWLEGLPDPRALEGLNQPTWRMLVGSLREKIALWRRRSEQRRLLAQINARSLRDAGVDPGVADFEAAQPFWRRPMVLRDLPIDRN